MSNFIETETQQILEDMRCAKLEHPRHAEHLTYKQPYKYMTGLCEASPKNTPNLKQYIHYRCPDCRLSNPHDSKQVYQSKTQLRQHRKVCVYRRITQEVMTDEA